MKKRTKKLSLNRETLLNLNELNMIQGAGLTDDCPTIPCITKDEDCSVICPEPIPTVDFGCSPSLACTSGAHTVCC